MVEYLQSKSRVSSSLDWLNDSRLGVTVRKLPEIDEANFTIVGGGKICIVGKSAFISSSSGNMKSTTTPSTKTIYRQQFTRMHSIPNGRHTSVFGRTMDERNEIEMQAIAAINKIIGSVCLFVIDATEARTVVCLRNSR